MIAYLTGKVIEKGHQYVILDVQGVGYSVSVVDERAYSLGAPVDLHIYFHWNQDQGPHLYGFQDVSSKAIFTAILSCSGCGPKIGLAVLAHMSPAIFVRAISLGHTHTLSDVSGIGPKKAELMIMQLKDKVAKMAPLGLSTQGSETMLKIKQVQDALAALRYKPSEITASVDYLTKQMHLETATVDELLRKGLSFLAKQL